MSAAHIVVVLRNRNKKKKKKKHEYFERRAVREWTKGLGPYGKSYCWLKQCKRVEVTGLQLAES